MERVRRRAKGTAASEVTVLREHGGAWGIVVLRNYNNGGDFGSMGTAVTQEDGEGVESGVRRTVPSEESGVASRVRRWIHSRR